MTPQEINIAIATACGWKPSPRWGIEIWIDPSGSSCFSDERPNYYGDLNACAEMEATLTHYEAWDYCDYLDGNVSAKAHQRCKAFLHVKGLWQE